MVDQTQNVVNYLVFRFAAKTQSQILPKQTHPDHMRTYSLQFSPALPYSLSFSPFFTCFCVSSKSAYTSLQALEDLFQYPSPFSLNH